MSDDDEEYLTSKGWKQHDEKGLRGVWIDPLDIMPVHILYDLEDQAVVAIQRGRNAAVAAERTRIMDIVRDEFGRLNVLDAIERQVREGK